MLQCVYFLVFDPRTSIVSKYHFKFCVVTSNTKMRPFLVPIPIRRLSSGASVRLIKYIHVVAFVNKDTQQANLLLIISSPNTDDDEAAIVNDD